MAGRRNAPRQAQDDGTILAIGEMERAGIDIVSDGEIRRESYSNRFALALEGVDADQPGEVRSQTGRITPVPRVVGKIRRRGPVELRDTEFLLRHATHATKITLPGPFTLTQQARNDFYKDEEELAMDYAIAVNEELRALKASGVDVVQIDEPWVRTAPEKAARYGLRAINRALEGIEGPTVVHLCFGYTAVVPTSRVDTASCRNWRTRRPIKSRSKRHNRIWTLVCCVISRVR